MNWKRNIIIVALVGVAALGFWRAFQPYDAQADAGDGDQVYSHSVLADCIDETELEDTIAGDSLCITATVWKVYSDEVYIPSAITGIDSIADSGDSVQVEISGITADESEWVLTLIPLGNWVSSLNVQTYWADTVSVHSSIAETGSDMKFRYVFELVTD